LIYKGWQLGLLFFLGYCQYSRKYSISIIINNVIDDFLFLINFGLILCCFFFRPNFSP